MSEKKTAPALIDWLDRLSPTVSWQFFSLMTMENINIG